MVAASKNWQRGKTSTWPEPKRWARAVVYIQRKGQGGHAVGGNGVRQVAMVVAMVVAIFLQTQGCRVPKSLTVIEKSIPLPNKVIIRVYVQYIF